MGIAHQRIKKIMHQQKGRAIGISIKKYEKLLAQSQRIPNIRRDKNSMERSNGCSQQEAVAQLYTQATPGQAAVINAFLSMNPHLP